MLLSCSKDKASPATNNTNTPPSIPSLSEKMQFLAGATSKEWIMSDFLYNGVSYFNDLEICSSDDIYRFFANSNKDDNEIIYTIKGQINFNGVTP
jgi:hypothetical protein